MNNSQLTHAMTTRINEATAGDLFIGLCVLEKMRAGEKGYDLEVTKEGEFIYHFKQEISK